MFLAPDNYSQRRNIFSFQMQDIGLFLLKAHLEFKYLQDPHKLYFASVLVVAGVFFSQKTAMKINVFYKCIIREKTSLILGLV